LNPQTNPGVFPGDNALSPEALINLHVRSAQSSTQMRRPLDEANDFLLVTLKQTGACCGK
jgi:hypothetical protein